MAGFLTDGDRKYAAVVLVVIFLSVAGRTDAGNEKSAGESVPHTLFVILFMCDFNVQ